MKYHLARDGDKLGEYSDLEISAGLRRGEFRATDLCWSAGMTDWQPLAERFPPPEPSADPEDEAELRWSAVPEAAGPEMASRWLRFLAWWVDWLTLLPVMMLISSALQLDAFAEKNQNLQPDQFVIAFQNHMQEMMQSHPQDFVLPGNLMLGIMILNMVLLTVRGQTVGKLLAGIRVVRFQSGARAGFLQAVLLRSGILFALMLIPYLSNGIWLVNTLCIFRTDRRCLHDLIADTMVIKQR